MIGETGERKSAVATPDGKSRKKKKKKKSVDPYGAPVGIPNDITRMRILASQAPDGSATEDVDPCDGVDASTSMG